MLTQNHRNALIEERMTQHQPLECLPREAPDHRGIRRVDTISRKNRRDERISDDQLTITGFDQCVENLGTERHSLVGRQGPGRCRPDDD